MLVPALVERVTAVPCSGAGFGIETAKYEAALWAKLGRCLDAAVMLFELGGAEASAGKEKVDEVLRAVGINTEGPRTTLLNVRCLSLN